MSDQDTTIFNNTTTTEPATTEPVVPPDPSTAIQVPDSVAELIGEGRKYKTIEDALNSIPHAQTHIEKLETEHEEYRTKLAAATTLDSVLDKIDSTPKTETTPISAEVNSNDLETRIAQVLDAKDIAATQQANQTTVTQKLTEIYGEKARDAYLEIASNNGLTVEALNNLASTSPQAVLNLLSSKPVQTPPTKTTSSVNTESFSHNTEQDVSARLPKNATTADTTNAWRAAGTKVQRS